MVVIEPSWPVFIAWSMSSTSSLRTSPTMIRSGRMRRQLRTRSRATICPLPLDVGRPGLQADDVPLLELELGGVLDGDDPLSPGMKAESAFSMVVLPVPVPPLMRMFSFAFTQAARKARQSGESVPSAMRSLALSGDVPKRRMERTGPSIASGGMMAFTRDPSGKPGVDHGRRLVDAAADPGDDAVDDAQQVIVVGESHGGELELAAALHVDRGEGVHQDVRDAPVPEQRLERTEPRQLVQEVLDHLLPLAHVQRHVGPAQDRGQHRPQLLAQPLRRELLQGLRDRGCPPPSGGGRS